MPESVPVYVMLPLDTVNAQGVFQYVATPWFADGLALLRDSGVKGVAVDCWWGAVEKSPQKYDFSAYRQVCNVVLRYNLKLQVVLSFHACGVNVNDDVHIPLPQWVRACGEKDPDIWYSNRPPGQGGSRHRNDECVSLFADHARCLLGRTPMQCYQDLMHAFTTALSDMLGTVIEEVVIGMGPCGELRYPAYSQHSGWKFPGIGTFQIYDRRALANLARAANEAGHPDWGRAAPEDVGECNSLPHDTDFFSWSGGWQTPRGEFFMTWYSACLKEHGRGLLDAAVRTFFPYMGTASQRSIRHHGRVDTSDLPTEAPPIRSASFSNMDSYATYSPRPMEVQSSGSSLHSRRGLSGRLCDLGEIEPGAHAGTGSDPCMGAHGRTASAGEAACTAPSTSSGAFSPASGGRAAERPAAVGAAGGDTPTEVERTGESQAGPAGVALNLSAASQAGLPYNGRSAGSLAGSATPLPLRTPLRISVKIAGVHWWYHSPSHAAELTAGYYNTTMRDGYADIVESCAQHGAGIILTCVEMCDTQHPPEAMCSPEGLLRQVREVAHRHCLRIAGENALPCITESGLNAHALDLVVRNTQSVRMLPRRASDVATRSLAQRHYQEPPPAKRNGAHSGSGLATVGPTPAGECHSIQGPVPLPHSISFSPPVQQYFMHGGLQRSVLRKATSFVDFNPAPVQELLDSGGLPLTAPGGVLAPSSIPEGHPQDESDELESVAAVDDDVPCNLEGDDGSAAPPGRCAAHAAPGVLPAMRMFTFLRLSRAMLQPGPNGQWIYFMSRMQQGKSRVR